MSGPLTNEEVDDLMNAVADRIKGTARMTPLQQALTDIGKRRPFRMKRFLKELAWLQNECAKRGVEMGETQ